MASKWRVLLSSIETKDAVADLITRTVCVLHNFLIDEATETAAQLADTGVALDDNGPWRREIRPLPQAEAGAIRQRGANRAPTAAQTQRRTLVEFFCGVGAVDWQQDILDAATQPVT